MEIINRNIVSSLSYWYIKLLLVIHVIQIVIENIFNTVVTIVALLLEVLLYWNVFFLCYVIAVVVAVTRFVELVLSIKFLSIIILTLNVCNNNTKYE